MDHDSTLSSVRARLGRNLKAARLDAGLTQQELASRAGVAPSLLVQVESGCGNPDLDAIGALARAVGRAAFELLDV
ncbi:MAG: helix-turn-helix transcriptional regulator [Rhodospirillales bacterium]|nr:helix-turn-helix transcriptional regulator [Rhodospirillales bacterium]